MTYLEKYKKEHPGLSEEEYRNVVIRDCPINKSGDVLRCPSYSSLGVRPGIATACPACWNQEIPGTKPTNKTKNDEREDKNMNKNFTKADLKVGYVVKYRNGNLRMVMPYANGLVLTSIDGQWLNIGTELNDDLTTKICIFGRGDALDVMEVYGLNSYGNFTCSISTDNRELLWKREENTCNKCAHETVCVFKKGISVNKDKCLHFLNK